MFFAAFSHPKIIFKGCLQIIRKPNICTAKNCQCLSMKHRIYAINRPKLSNENCLYTYIISFSFCNVYENKAPHEMWHNTTNDTHRYVYTHKSRVTPLVRIAYIAAVPSTHNHINLFSSLFNVIPST